MESSRGRLSRDYSVSSYASVMSDSASTNSPVYIHARNSYAHLLPDKSPKRHRVTMVTTMPTKCFVGFSLIFSVLSLACSGYLFMTVFLKENTDKTVQQSVCMPCSVITSGPFLEDNPKIQKLDQHKENKSMMCCAKTPEQYSILFRLVLERKRKMNEVEDMRAMQSKQQSPTDSSLKMIGAHLLAGLQRSYRRKRTSSGDSQPPVRSWLKDQSLSYLEGVHLVNDRLIVEQSGLYYVYSQIYFKVSLDGPEGVPRSKILGHKVHRYNVIIPNGGREDLLQTVHTCCSSKDRNIYFHTSYVGGIFHLNTGDELYVTVSDATYIARDPKPTFFGVFKLGR